jgi:hypothetical protein
VTASHGNALEHALAFYAEPAAVPRGRTPFRFLDSYERADRDYFFGRDAEIEDLRSRFYRCRVFVVYGESGAGKTSLLQCGLGNAIPEEDAEFHFIRSNVDPIAAVRLRLAGEPTASGSLADLIDARARSVSRTVALVFDQFEELFLFQPVEVRRRLLDELREAIARRLDVRVVFCLREEFLSRMTEVEGTIPDVFANRFWLRRMRASDARSVIEAPCRTTGIAIEDGVAAMVIERLRDPRGDIDLPYLQIVLDQLYRRAQARGGALTFSTQDVAALGTTEEILSSFLESRIRELKFPELGREILKLFVTSAHTRRAVDAAAVARAMSSKQLPSWPPRMADDAGPSISATLTALIEARILRQDDVDAPYELRHDTLAEAITRWLTPLEEEYVKLRSLIENRYAEYRSTGALIHDHKLLARIEPHLGKLGLPLEMSELVRRSLADMTSSSRRRVRLVTVALAIGFAILGALIYYLVDAMLNVRRDREVIAQLRRDATEQRLIARARELEAAKRGDAARALIWARQKQGDAVVVDPISARLRDGAVSLVIESNPTDRGSPLDGDTVFRWHDSALERVQIAKGSREDLHLPHGVGSIIALAHSDAALAAAWVTEVQDQETPRRINRVAIWSKGRGEPQTFDVMEGSDTIVAMAFASEAVLVVATDRGVMFRISSKPGTTGELTLELVGQLPFAVSVMAPQPGKPRVALGDRAGHVTVWPVYSDTIPPAFPQHRCPVAQSATRHEVVALQWTSRGEQLYALAGATTPRGWGVDENSEASEIDLECDVVSDRLTSALALSSNGYWLAVGDTSGGVRLWDTTGVRFWYGGVTAGRIFLGDGNYVHHTAISALAFGADGSVIIGDDGGGLSIWDPTTEVSRWLEGHTQRISSIALVEKYRQGEATATLVSAEPRGTIRIWEVPLRFHNAIALFPIADFETRNLWWAHQDLILMSGGCTLHGWRWQRARGSGDTFEIAFDGHISDVLVAPGMNRSIVVVTGTDTPHLINTDTGREGPPLEPRDVTGYQRLPHPGTSPDGKLEVARDNHDAVSIFELKDDPVPAPVDFGSQSNVRICKDSLEAVALLPYPPASELWADEVACAAR